MHRESAREHVTGSVGVDRLYRLRPRGANHHPTERTVEPRVITALGDSLDRRHGIVELIALSPLQL